MSAVDDYLATLEPERRAVLEHIRAVVHELVPGAVETESYRMPTFDVAGKHVLAFLSAKQHLSVFPFSRRVVDALRGRLAGYSLSAGTIRFTLDRPLPDDLLRDLIRKRLDEIGGKKL